jgi:aminoglycoside phosphotransferase (APT) family kinase protein
MTYYEPAKHPLWKEELMRREVDTAFARTVGAAIAQIHAGTAGASQIAAEFATDALFMALRVEPYLLHTACVHSDRRDVLHDLAEELLASKLALVHGDVSPKNILKGPSGPIFLDAECAWYGDPAFDLAFCLTHLLLKALKFANRAEDYLKGFDALGAAYLGAVRWEGRSALDARAARLLGAIALARVDGKSPVEYLNESGEKDFVRAATKRYLAARDLQLEDIRRDWAARLGAR